MDSLALWVNFILVRYQSAAAMPDYDRMSPTLPVSYISGLELRRKYQDANRKPPNSGIVLAGIAGNGFASSAKLRVQYTPIKRKTPPGRGFQAAIAGRIRRRPVPLRCPS